MGGDSAVCVEEHVEQVSAFGRVPAFAALGVFVPIILTTVIPKVLRPQVSAIIQAYPYFPFVLYALCNWGLIGFGWAWLRRRGVTLGDLGIGRFRGRDVAIGVAAAMVGLFVVYPAASWILSAMGFAALNGKPYPSATVLDVICAILFPSVLVPISEEVIFRAYLCSLLRARLRNVWLAGLLGTLMFVAIHVPFFGWTGMLFYVLLWTPLPVGLFLWRRNILGSSVMHVLNNSFAYIVVPMIRG